MELTVEKIGRIAAGWRQRPIDLNLKPEDMPTARGIHIMLEPTYNTSMTVIVGMKYRGGILLKCDSLHLEHDTKSKAPNKVIGIRYGDKIRRLSKYCLIGFSSNDFYLSTQSLFVGILALFGNTKGKKLPLEGKIEVMTPLLEGIRKEMRKKKKDTKLEILLAFYDFSSKPPEPHLLKIVLGERLTIEDCGNYAAIGSSTVTDTLATSFKEGGYDIEYTLYDDPPVNGVIDELIEKCSDTEKAYIDVQEPSPIHVGGTIYQWRITKEKGAKRQSFERRLPTYIKLEDEL